MFIGEYRHTLDSKNRISLPAKFRKELGSSVVVTRGLDHCLFIYGDKAWKNFSEKLSGLGVGQSDTRAFNRFILAGAIEGEIDTAGRVLIPDFLRDFASLKNSLVLAGVGNRVEIWDEKSWDAYKRSVDDKADTLAEKLGDIGMI